MHVSTCGTTAYMAAQSTLHICQTAYVEYKPQLNDMHYKSKFCILSEEEDNSTIIKNLWNPHRFSNKLIRLFDNTFHCP